ncbi:MAG: cobalamin-binding protein [Calditrichaeota bacterium]|nr:cobalamin-binding protein [Calditrichota bacterium]
MTAHPRIVTLLAAATEIVCALGLQDHLVGISHECDYPESIRDLPRCTSPKFQLDGTSYDIDQRVRAIAQEGLSVYRMDVDLLNRLRPDVIVTQIQCEVCAVSLPEVERAVAQLVSSRPQIVPLNPVSLSDVWEDIHRVARALNVPHRGERLVAQLKQRMAAIHRKSRGCPNRPRVVSIEWLDPLIVGGNWMPELVERAGGKHLLAQAGQHSPIISLDQLLNCDPDVLVIVPCGFTIDQTLKEMPTLTTREEWAQLQAVQNGRVFIADGNQFFNRSGPRLVESLEMLAEMLHPNQFDFGHRDRNWIAYMPIRQ